MAKNVYTHGFRIVFLCDCTRIQSKQPEEGQSVTFHCSHATVRIDFHTALNNVVEIHSVRERKTMVLGL